MPVGRLVGSNSGHGHGHPAESPFRFHIFGPPPRASRSLSLHHRSLSPASSPTALLWPLTAPSGQTRSARSPPRPCLCAAARVCLGPAIPARFALPFSDLQPSLRPASICDTSPASEHLPHHHHHHHYTTIAANTQPTPTLSTPPVSPLLHRSRLPSCVAPVHDGVTAPRFLGGLLFRQTSTTLCHLDAPCSLTTRAARANSPPIGNHRPRSSPPTAPILRLDM
jgi:hypothetical protein